MLPELGSSMKLWIWLIIAVAMSGTVSLSMNCETASQALIASTDFFWMSL